MNRSNQNKISFYKTKICLMKNIVTYIIFCFFVIYWSTTFFFTFPENPLNVKSIQLRRVFDSYFYQQWSFFAPPATFNERLYFSYFYHDPATKTQKIRTFEILDPITKEKRKHTPFNKPQDVLDYVISGSVTDIQNNLKEAYDMIKVEDKENKKVSNQEEKTKKVLGIIEKTESFYNLLNYAKVVAKNNNVPTNDTKYKIIITNVAIPKFLYKNTLNKKEENVILSSNFYSLKTAK